MQVQIKIQRNTQYTGRKSSTGKICFDERGKMGVFVEYCPDCRGKIIMELPEAKKFSKLYCQQVRRPINRTLLAVMRKRIVLQ